MLRARCRKSQDANGNPAGPISNTTITLSKATGGGTLSGTLTGTILTTGSSVTISTPIYSKSDTMTLTTTATAGQTSLTAITSGNIVFSSGAPNKLAFTTSPSNSTGGLAFGTQPVVTLEDANGNTVTGISQNVTLAIQNNAGPGGVLSGATTAAVNTSTGQATFSGLSINKAATGYTLTATGSTFSTTPGIVVSGAFNIAVGPAAKFAIVGSGTQIAGSTNNLTITAQDAGGNAVTSYSGNHNLIFSGANPSMNPATNPTATNSGGTAINFGAATGISFTNGVSSAGGVMKLYKAETATVSVTDGSISSSAGLTVVVSAASANRVVWGQQPPATVSRAAGNVGTPISPAMTVFVEDQFGNLTTGTTVTISVTFNFTPSSQDAIGGTLLASGASGTATFSNVYINGNKNGSPANFTATMGSFTVNSVSFAVGN